MSLGLEGHEKEKKVVWDICNVTKTFTKYKPKSERLFSRMHIQTLHIHTQNKANVISSFISVFVP